MKDVILVGKGKASRIHTMSYNKSKEKINLYYADIDIPIQKIIEDNNLDINNIIVDIVTPKEVFIDVIEACESLGLYDIIVEKPFVIEDDFFLKHPKLNIVMVQNYMYSVTTNYVKKYIEYNNLKIKLIMTNFSKNRINESIKMRGMSSKITENYEIEVPHQVYICDYILGGRSTLLMLEQKDMHNIDRTLKNHGYSFSLVRNKDVLISHQCDLTSNTLHKGMTIYCENNVVISVEYSIYDKDLDCLRNSRVVVYKDRKKILDEEIIDDNMYYCLKEYYEYFNSKKENNIYKERIINFSNIMKEYKGFSKEYC